MVRNQVGSCLKATGDMGPEHPGSGHLEALPPPHLLTCAALSRRQTPSPLPSPHTSWGVGHQLQEHSGLGGRDKGWADTVLEILQLSLTGRGSHTQGMWCQLACHCDKGPCCP